MAWNQIVFGALLVAALVFLAVFYGWRQVLALRGQRHEEDPTSDEAVYQRRRAWLRLVNSVLMLVLAVLLAGMLIGFENQAQQLADERDAIPQDQKQPLTQEQLSFVHAYSRLWIGFLLVLLTVIVVAAVDAWSTRAFGLRQYRKLQADRRDMIERQVIRLRQERNGH
jgi:hypothetical protein